jgi:hypothetical protein
VGSALVALSHAPSALHGLVGDLAAAVRGARAKQIA